MLEFFVSWCEERKPAQCVPVAAEQEFEIEIAGKKVIGYIDRIDRTPAGDHEVFDYKTGKSMLTGNTIRKDIQMNLYSLAIEDLYGKLPASANLLYVRKEIVVRCRWRKRATIKSRNGVPCRGHLE